jgi:ATP-binding cassette, subfamily B, bacterial
MLRGVRHESAQSPGHGAPKAPDVTVRAPDAPGFRQFFSLFEYTGRAFRLVFETSHAITIWLGTLSALAGLLPAAIAYVGKLIVDAVVLASSTSSTSPTSATSPLSFVLLELGLVVALAATQRGLMICESLLRALLGQRVNELILEKALTLELADFEDSEFYDRMTRARREASARPLSLVKRAFGLVQNAISVVVYAGLLWQLSPWAALVLSLAAVPVFVAETRFSADAFRLFRFRAPEARKQTYLETLLAREDHAKEVKLFGLGPLFLERYRSIFRALFGEDRALSIRRGTWGFALGLLSTLAFYGAYAWIVTRAITGAITLGDMTMYLLVFKQGQTALAAILSAVGGMYEDNLYLSNLYEFLGHTSKLSAGTKTAGPDPRDGIRFSDVSFSYPGSSAPALEHIDVHITPGSKLALVGENGAGKTTLIKLLTGLYTPTHGTISLDGLPLPEWDSETLRLRIGVIFQDFIRYQLLVGENIGAGDVRSFEDESRWQRAAEKGMAAPFVQHLPQRYHTQLGSWFKGGQELSVGQWQKIALSRAFMREDADILVLDEPTASMDAEAESEIFQRFRNLAANRMGIVISHRFSTVRMADQIVVLESGRIVEQGSHDALLAKNGRYAQLFNLQAAGYQ